MRRLICRILGHQLRVTRAFTAYRRRVTCGRCGGDWLVNDRVAAFAPWSDSFEHMD
jgi:hypothetical protein